MSKENLCDSEPLPFSTITIDNRLCSQTLSLVQNRWSQEFKRGFLIEKKSKHPFIDINLRKENGVSYDHVLTIKTIPVISYQLGRLLSASSRRLRADYFRLIKELADTYDPQIRLTPDFLQMDCLKQWVFVLNDTRSFVNQSLLDQIGVEQYKLCLEKSLFSFSFETPPFKFECDIFSHSQSPIKACLFAQFSPHSFSKLRDAFFDAADNNFQSRSNWDQFPADFDKNILHTGMRFDLV